MEDISLPSCKDCIQWVIENNFATEKATSLNLMICSPGGEMSAAFALIDVMKGSSIPINTIGIGEIASAGLLIFLSGQKGGRILTPNTSILSHQYSWGSSGKHHELISCGKEVDLIYKRMMNVYKKSTKLKEEEIKKLLLPPHDVWLDSKEALKYGICDVVKELN